MSSELTHAPGCAAASPESDDSVECQPDSDVRRASEICVERSDRRNACLRGRLLRTSASNKRTAAVLPQCWLAVGYGESARSRTNCRTGSLRRDEALVLSPGAADR